MATGDKVLIVINHFCCYLVNVGFSVEVP